MRILSTGTLSDFWERHPDAAAPLQAWVAEVKQASWRTPADLKGRYPRASVIGGGRVVFRIKGNRYRLVARINYERQDVLIKFIGTHAEYDRIDAEEV